MPLVQPLDLGTDAGLQYALYWGTIRSCSVTVLNLFFRRELKAEQLYPLLASLAELSGQAKGDIVLIGAKSVNCTPVTTQAAVLELAFQWSRCWPAVGAMDYTSFEYRLYASSLPDWPPGATINSSLITYGGKLTSSDETDLL